MLYLYRNEELLEKNTVIRKMPMATPITAPASKPPSPPEDGDILSLRLVITDTLGIYLRKKPSINSLSPDKGAVPEFDPSFDRAGGMRIIPPED